MALKIVIELDDLEEKCIKTFAADPEEWVRNIVESRVFSTKHEIYKKEVERMTNDPNVKTIPANVEEVVKNAKVKFANEEDPPAMPEV